MPDARDINAYFGLGIVTRRSVPVPHVVAPGTGARDVFTVRENTMFEIRQLCVLNHTSNDQTLTVWSVPPGGTRSDSNMELKNLFVPAQSVVVLGDQLQQLYSAGTVLQIRSGAGNALVVHGWGDEIL